MSKGITLGTILATFLSLSAVGGVVWKGYHLVAAQEAVAGKIQSLEKTDTLLNLRIEQNALQAQIDYYERLMREEQNRAGLTNHWTDLKEKRDDLRRRMDLITELLLKLETGAD